jgi:hypothetical protein
MIVGGEQEVYENVDFAAKEDLLRWLDLDYTQVNTAHHLRNKVRLIQPGLRIRIGSGFNRVSGSGSGIRTRIQDKNDPQK